MRIFHQMRLSKRSRKLGESLDDPSVVEFESLYQREDPWGINKSVPAMARISMIKNLFRFDKFKNSLDIGCGEGFIIGALDFIENITAIDISQIALARAKRKYPEINFLWGDINDLSLIADDQFDFISCFETLYYIDSRSKRKQVLAQIEKKGRDKCVFAFSVVTGGG
jgi:predicted TPR repeat methyltransferase